MTTFLEHALDAPEARLLIVDDEAHIRSALIRALGLMGYFVEDAGSGQEALALLERKPFDLMVLDMRMPGMDGMEVMQRAQQIRPGLLTIVLTGRATLETAIAAVKTEAVVDYLLKPASIHEVAGAIARALKRYAERLERERLVATITTAVQELHQTQAKGAPSGVESSAGRFLHVAPITLDQRKRLVIFDDNTIAPVELTEGEAAVMACLMAHPDEVLTFSDLARAVWGQDVTEIEAQGPVRSYVFRLRRKLESDPRIPRLVSTVRGGGYLFGKK